VREDESDDPSRRRRRIRLLPPATAADRGGGDDARSRGDDSRTLETASALTDPSYHPPGRGNGGGCYGYAIGGGGAGGGGGSGGGPGCGAAGDGAGVGGLGPLLRCGATTLSELAGMVLNGDDDDDGVDEAVAAMLDGDGGDADDAGAMAGWATVAEEAERRDDVESAERDGGRPAAAAAVAGEGGVAHPPGADDTGMMSPISRALAAVALVTPLASLLSDLAGRLSFFGNGGGDDADVAAADGNNGNHVVGKVLMREEPTFRRVCMVVSPDEVRSCLEGTSDRGRGVGLLGMKFHQCGRDFQAHVRWMQRGSKAERMGVRVGDVVSVSWSCVRRVFVRLVFPSRFVRLVFLRIPSLEFRRP